MAFYYLWYAGVDMVAHPQYAYYAVTNGHVGEEAAALRDEVRVDWEATVAIPAGKYLIVRVDF